MTITPYSIEYNLLYSLAIILLIATFVLACYLAKRVFDRMQERGKFETDFLFGIFLLIFGLFISGIIYFYYDFYLAYYDPLLLHIYPNIIFWKAASFFYSICFTIFLFIVDKKMLQFRLKGILAYILFAFALFQFFYPVQNEEDFQLISAVGVIGSLVLISLPILLIYIGIKKPELRRITLLFVLGIILYFIGGTIDSEFIVAPLQTIFGPQTRFYIILITTLLKISGLTIMTFSSAKIYI